MQRSFYYTISTTSYTLVAVARIIRFQTMFNQWSHFPYFLVLPQKPPPDCRSFLFLYVSIYVYVTGKYCFSVINMANITLFMAYLCVSSIFKYHHQLFYGIKFLVVLRISFLFAPHSSLLIKNVCESKPHKIVCRYSLFIWCKQYCTQSLNYHFWSL